MVAPKVQPEDEDFVRKPLKISDLPIHSTQRNAIDGLLHSYKKKGEFDKLRKEIYNQFAQSVSLAAYFVLWLCADTV